MHYKPGTSDQKQAQESPRLLALVSTTRGRRFERPDHEHEVEQPGTRRRVGHAPHGIRSRNGLKYDALKQQVLGALPTSRSSKRRRMNSTWMTATSATNAAQPLEEVSTSTPTDISADSSTSALSRNIPDSAPSGADIQSEFIPTSYLSFLPLCVCVCRRVSAGCWLVRGYAYACRDALLLRMMPICWWKLAPWRVTESRRLSVLRSPERPDGRRPGSKAKAHDLRRKEEAF